MGTGGRHMRGPEGDKPPGAVARVLPFRPYLPTELPTDGEALLKVLHDAMQPQLLRYAEAFAPHDDAREIVQNAFCALWNRHLRNGGRPQELDYPGMLWRTVRSRCLDYLRNKRTSRAALEQFRHFAAARIPGWMNPFRERERTEARDFLTDAMKLMNPRCREVFVMKHLSHMRVNEIAERLGVPRSTIMGMLQRALCTVRDHADRTGYRRRLGAGESDHE